MNFHSAIFSKYLSDDDIGKILSDEEFIRKIFEFEIVLAKEQSRLGIIPESASNEIRMLLSELKIQPGDLADGTLKNGIPLIPLLEIIKEKLSVECRQYLHFGTTSQDVMDSALVLTLQDAFAIINERLANLQLNLSKLREKYGETPCMARTRGQLAVPITFAQKINAWLYPLQRQAHRIKGMEADVLKVQLGGAAGDLAAFGKKGEHLSEAIAKALRLSRASSWHTQRDGLCEFTNWLALTSGILGKMGADLLVMAQSEVGEIAENAEGGGKSTAMLHKNNPILSEALVALAKLNAGLQSQMLLSVIHENERDATAWILEWSCIPQMLMNTGTALKHALTISINLKVNTDVMKKNVERFQNKD
ncbi:MAG TPA: lyase family protein [Chryseolinea sp.]